MLACGGTHLLASASEIRSEVVWNDGDQGGGGVSAVFALPVWQNGLNVTRVSGAKSALTKRGVPDVAGDASPLTGYDVIIGGTQTVVGSTSAVAPLWAGLIPDQRGGVKAGGFPQPEVVRCEDRGPRHHAGKQRQLRGDGGLRRLHGSGQPGRRESRGCAEVAVAGRDQLS